MKKHYSKFVILTVLILFMANTAVIKAGPGVDSISVTIYCDARDTVIDGYNNAMFITGSFTNPGGDWFLMPMESVMPDVYVYTFKYLPGSLAGDTTDYYFATADDWSESSREIVPEPCNRSWDTQRTFFFDIYTPDSVVAFKFGKCAPVPIPGVDAVEDISSESFNIFPNPANGIINLEIPSLNQNAAMDIFDFSGKSIKKIRITGNNTTIDVSDLPSGIYMIRINDGETIRCKKIILN